MRCQGQLRGVEAVVFASLKACPLLVMNRNLGEPSLGFFLRTPGRKGRLPLPNSNSLARPYSRPFLPPCDILSLRRHRKPASGRPRSARRRSPLVKPVSNPARGSNRAALSNKGANVRKTISFVRFRTNLKPKSYRLAGISYDENCRGDRRSVSKGCVYAPYAPYAIEGLCLRDPWLARNRHSISRFPADSLPLSNGHVRSGQGVPPSYIHTVSILLLKTQGNFRELEDELRIKLLVPDKPYNAPFMQISG